MHVHMHDHSLTTISHRWLLSWRARDGFLLARYTFKCSIGTVSVFMGWAPFL